MERQPRVRRQGNDELLEGGILLSGSSAAGSGELSIVRVKASTRIDDDGGGGVKDANAECPYGSHVIGGGFSSDDNSSSDLTIVRSSPIDHSRVWRVVAVNSGDLRRRFVSWAICTATTHP